MAKIFKSFQVKIDKEHVQKIWTGQKIKPEKPKINISDGEDSEGFKEIPPEKLGGTPSESSPGAPQAVAPDSDQDEISEEERVASAIARASAILNAANRRSSEISLKEEKLRDWEKALIEREQLIEKEEAKLHQEILARRKALEEECAKMLEMAKKSADTILKTASAEAETMKKALQIELESIRAKAQKEGFALGEEKGIAAGEKAGFEEGKLEWQALIQETEMLVTELQTSRIGILKSMEEEMVKLILAFAKRVLKVECQTRPEIILNNIDAAINKISEVDKIILRINMRDKSLAESRKEDFMKRLSGIGELKIIEDSSLSPGGLRIETGVGCIDATIEAQAEELEKNILKVLKRSD